MRLILTAALAGSLAAAALQPALAAPGPAPETTNTTQTAWSPRAASAVLAALDQALEGYVWPDRARAAQAALRAGRTRYLAITDRVAFADAVARELDEARADPEAALRRVEAVSAP